MPIVVTIFAFFNFKNKKYHGLILFAEVFPGSVYSMWFNVKPLKSGVINLGYLKLLWHRLLVVCNNNFKFFFRSGEGSDLEPVPTLSRLPKIKIVQETFTSQFSILFLLLFSFF